MSDNAELRAELARLAARVEALQARLDAVRLHEVPTMRARVRCPLCATTRIAHAKQVLDRGDGDFRKALALNKPSVWSSSVIGELEAFACTGCGFVEWYVKDPAGLREVGDQLVMLDGSVPEAGPYR